MRSLAEIAHEFKIKYGLAPYEPTEEQLLEILSRVASWEAETGRTADDQTIEAVVRDVCPTYRTHKYAAQGYQEMRDLLVQLQALAQPKK